MKKIVLSMVAVSSLLLAQGVETNSPASLLESKKVGQKSNTGVDDLLQISLIVDGSYDNIKFDDEGEKEHVGIPGFIHGGGHGHDDHGHAHGSLTGEDGFNFNYAELSMASSIDNYFDLMAVFHLSEDDFEVEEAYATTRSLPYNLRARVGKFKSDFGYLNNKHHHNYNFSDAPLVYQAILGDHGLTEKGIQLQYVLPTSSYFMAGVEVLRGENEQSFGTAELHDVDDVEQPNLVVGYLKTSHDVAGGTLLAGASIAKGKTRLEHLEDEDPHAFAGDTTLYGVDLTYKHYFAADRALTWQSEYLYREMDGTKYVAGATHDEEEHDDHDEHEEWANQMSLLKEQGGFYTELVYQHDKNWRAGVRYSAITQNDVTAGGTAKNMIDDMSVTSLMLEYNPSEFSRIRLQYSRNAALYTDEGERNNQDKVTLQFNYAIGAHGAHSF
jgi:hypothetical protein